MTENKKKYRKIITIALWALLVGAQDANAILSVIDSDNLANSVKQVASWSFVAQIRFGINYPFPQIII